MAAVAVAVAAAVAVGGGWRAVEADGRVAAAMGLAEAGSSLPPAGTTLAPLRWEGKRARAWSWLQALCPARRPGRPPGLPSIPEPFR
jgi:hypothetical protein